MSEHEHQIEVKNLSKKFCRKLKRSLWYGIKDIGTELTAGKRADVQLRKDEFWALKDVDFQLKKGELVGLIGPNGAGKTTLLKLLSGLVKPDVGEILIRGKIQALIALGAGFNPILTGRENVYINGAILGFTKKELDGMLEEILAFSEIGEFIDMPVQSYSSGMHVRLGFAVAVNLKPDILIVDEVLAVGDASFRRKARNKMMELLHSGISVLFVSHNMDLMSSLTTRCLYLKRGRMMAFGPTDEVITQYMHDATRRELERLGDGANDLMASAYYSMPDIFALNQVQLYNQQNKESDEFTADGKIKIKVEVEFFKSFEKVTFALSILEGIDGTVITSGKFTPDKKMEEGIVRLECEFDETRLREGIYNLGFYAQDFNGGALFKSNNVGSFSILANLEIIRNSDALLGLVAVHSDWKLND